MSDRPSQSAESDRSSGSVSGSMSNSRLRIYPVPAGAVLHDGPVVRVRIAGDDLWHEVPTYRVRVNMHDVTEASMAYFDFDGTVEVEIAERGWCYFYTADIRPLSLGITLNVEPRRASFTLAEPANLSVEINRDRAHNLHLFAGSLSRADELDGADIKADVVVEGRMNGPNTLGRDVLQRLNAMRRGDRFDDLYLDGIRVKSERTEEVFTDGIDRDDSDPGHTAADPDRNLIIRVKPGHYCIEDGVLSLPSHTTLIIEGGAILEGALRVDHAEAVRIMGRGLLYLADFKRFSGTCAITVVFSRSVTIDGLCCINPPHYTVMLGSSQSRLQSDSRWRHRTCARGRCRHRRWLGGGAVHDRRIR